MTADDRMPVHLDVTKLLTLSTDHRTIRLNVPRLQLAAQSKPLDIFLDLDSNMVLQVMVRLVELRAQMTPASNTRH